MLTEIEKKELKKDEEALRSWIVNVNPRSANYARWHKAWFRKRLMEIYEGIEKYLPIPAPFCDDWKGVEKKPRPATCNDCKKQITDMTANNLWIGSGCYPKAQKFEGKVVISLCDACLVNFEEHRPSLRKEGNEVTKIVQGPHSSTMAQDIHGNWFDIRHFNQTPGFKQLEKFKEAV